MSIVNSDYVSAVDMGTKLYASQNKQNEISNAKKRFINTSVTTSTITNSNTQPKITKGSTVVLDAPTLSMVDVASSEEMQGLIKKQTLKHIDSEQAIRISKALQSSLTQSDALLSNKASNRENNAVNNRNANKNGSITSSAQFAVMLSHVISDVSNSQLDLKLEELMRLREINKSQLEKNSQALNEAADSQAAAAKAKRASEILGWLSGGAQVIAGIVLMVTGIGFSVGVMMIVSGGISGLNALLMNNDLQRHMGRKGSEIATYVLTAVQLIVMFASIAVAITNPGSAAAVGANIASGVGVLASQVQLTIAITQALTALGAGVSATISAAAQAEMAKSNAKIKESQADIALLRSLIQRLQRQLSTIASNTADVMQLLINLIYQEAQSKREILSRIRVV